jgi:hypothetical protein
MSIRIGDLGTPELRNHHTIVIEETEDHISRARNITQTPLDWYLARNYITQEQWQAGNRMYCSFVQASFTQVTVTDFMRVSQKNKPRNFSDTQIAAREQFYKALHHLETEGQQLVLSVCCFSEWPYNQGFPRKYAIARLRSALQELAGFFRLLPNERGKNAKHFSA